MKLKKFNLITKILFHVTLVIYGIFAVASPILFTYSDQVNNFLKVETQVGTGANGNTYYDTKFNTMEEVRNASLDIIEETMAEGAVLLKNDNDALPLSANDDVTLYGMASYYSVHSGQGSSGSEKKNGSDALKDRVSLYEGLTAAGLNVNSALNDWYSRQSVATYLGSADFMGAEAQESQFVVKDIAWNSISESAKSNKAEAAIMVLARNSGEAVDLYMDTTMDDNSTRVIVSKNNNNKVSGSVGDALELTSAEKSVLENLKTLKNSGTINKIIVIMNSASPLQCEFLDNAAYGIDSCLWVGTIGTNGANAIGKILTGAYNPSGRTSDTFWANSKYNPVYYNFGALEFGDSGKLANYYQTLGEYNNKFYVAYQEGIYNGYKYTETRYEDLLTGRPNVGTFDYNKVVSYPFGYGLSYTEFKYSGMKVNEGKGTYTVSVDVENTGDVAGKEVVQIYVQKPYTQTDIDNGVEKPSVELVGFAKTKLLEPGDKDTLKIEVQEKYFAAYDANEEKTYVIGTYEKNEKYLLTAAKDAHDAVNNILQYKSENNIGTVNTNGIVSNVGRGKGDADLVWGKHIEYSALTYSTNEFIDAENELDPAYDGAAVNYGVDRITNQFDDSDFQKAGIFSDAQANQKYLSRNDWNGTYGIQIKLTANDKLKDAQKAPAVKPDDVPYPQYEQDTYYESDEVFDEMKLIYLRGKDYNDPLWNDLLDKMSYEDYCTLLQNGLRTTKGVDSIAAPLTAQQNGALAPVHSRTWDELPSQVEGFFRGFAEQKDPDNKGNLPPVFVCNGIVASTYNTELILRLGKQTGEEAAWAGYNGIYGLGVNIHRGAYCGRTFEYYSEDGYLTGVAAGYEAVGLHRLGVFVLMKHAILNDQETHRAGLCVWANEQTIREIYCRAIEVAVEIDREMTPRTVLGVMTGMNRVGAKWSGGQGFCNTVLKAEFGMRGYVVSDYNNVRYYMSPVQGVLNGNDLPDGTTTWNDRGGKDYDGNDAQFSSYAPGGKENYGELAWAMRDAAHAILYTVVNSNAMNGIDGDSSFTTITPAWQIAIPIVTRVAMVLFIWSTLAYASSITAGYVDGYLKKRQTSESASGEKFDQPIEPESDDPPEDNKE